MEDGTCKLESKGTFMSEKGTSVSNIFPVTTDDERDPREDQKDDRQREEEIKGDRPPHHGGE